MYDSILGMYLREGSHWKEQKIMRVLTRSHTIVVVLRVFVDETSLIGIFLAPLFFVRSSRAAWLDRCFMLTTVLRQVWCALRPNRHSKTGP